MEFDFIINVDVGGNVFCDLCGKDWTHDNTSGGFLFGSKAVCPDCAPDFKETVERCNEEDYIRATCPKDTSYADWVRNSLR